MVSGQKRRNNLMNCYEAEQAMTIEHRCEKMPERKIIQGKTMFVIEDGIVVDLYDIDDNACPYCGEKLTKGDAE